MLQDFVSANRDEIILRCRAKVATRLDPPPTAAEVDHGVPLFLDQLVDALRLGLSANTEIHASAVLHGHDLLLKGFTVSQVVHDYGDVCQSITDLAVERDKTIAADDFRTLNRCLDDAIASAVTEYGRERSAAGQATGGTERLMVLTAELKTLVQTMSVALQAIKSGTVGVAGSTGKVLDRSVLAASDLIDRVLTEIAAARTQV